MAYTTIDKSDDYFNTVLYTGNGSSGTDITGVGFQPDFTWLKIRNQSFDHALQDSVRGATKDLETSSGDAEQTRSMLTAFISDGFTLGSDSQSNSNGNTFVAWNWLAGGTASSNTDGSITSTVSANTTSGFSIVGYTGNGSSGATIGHSLGSAPNVVIIKNRDNADPFTCFFSVLGNGKYIELSETSPEQTTNAAGRWNNTDPSSTLVTLGNNDDVNGNTEDYIAYCFAEKKGFSKFGSYTGNGNADGPFIYTGFKPAFVMVKNTGAAESWIIFDNKRPGYNLTDALLKPNLNNAESTTGVKFDMVSTGFKARVSDAEGNSSGGNFIYMAFAENPLVTSTGIPACAR